MRYIYGRREKRGCNGVAGRRGVSAARGGGKGVGFSDGGGFRLANRRSRLSDTPSYLPESLAEPQLLRILPRDGELLDFCGRGALQLIWVQLAGVSGGYGARNGFRRAKNGRFSRGRGFQRGRRGLAGRDDDSGRRKKKFGGNHPVRRLDHRFSRSNSNLTIFRSN